MVNKTRVFYPVIWAFFVGGVLIGTIGANFVSKETIQSFGIYKLYIGTYLDTFSIFEKEWIVYIILHRMKVWILYLLLVFTSAKLVVVSCSSFLFGWIGASLLVVITRVWGGCSLILFGVTLIPHYILYCVAILMVMEIVRVTTIVHRKQLIEKVITASLFWCAGVILEMFVNPTIVYWVVRLFV